MFFLHFLTLAETRSHSIAWQQQTGFGPLRRVTVESITPDSAADENQSQPSRKRTSGPAAKYEESEGSVKSPAAASKKKPGRRRLPVAPGSSSEVTSPARVSTPSRTAWDVDSLSDANQSDVVSLRSHQSSAPASSTRKSRPVSVSMIHDDDDDLSRDAISADFLPPFVVKDSEDL